MSRDNIVRDRVGSSRDLIPLYPALLPEHIEILAGAEGSSTRRRLFEVEDVLEAFMQDVIEIRTLRPLSWRRLWQEELSRCAIDR